MKTWRYLTAVIKQGYWPALKTLKTGHHALHVRRKRGPGVSNFSRVTLFKFRSSFQFCEMAGTTRYILSIPEGLEQSIPQPEGNLSMLGSCENSREICARKERRVSGAGHFLFDQPMRSLHPPVFQISSMGLFFNVFYMAVETLPDRNPGPAQRKKMKNICHNVVAFPSSISKRLLLSLNCKKTSTYRIFATSSCSQYCILRETLVKNLAAE